MPPKSLKRSSAHLSERPSTAKKPKTQFPGSQDPKHVLPPTHTFLISVPATGKRIPLRVLLDTGTGVACLDVGYVQRHGIPTRPLSRPLLLRSADGTPLTGAGETATPKLKIRSGTHESELEFMVSKLSSNFDAILPNWWIVEHPCRLNASGGLRFDSDSCKANCLDVSAGLDVPDHPSEDQRIEQGILDFINGTIDLEGEEDAYLVAAIAAVALEGATTSEERANIERIVPIEYHSYLEVFGERFANRLPPHEIRLRDKPRIRKDSPEPAYV